MNNETRERLAAYAHEAWSGWMAYLFEKAVVNEDGTATIPAWAVERWTRQMNTPYADLSQAEKNSDLAEADKMLEAMWPSTALAQRRGGIVVSGSPGATIHSSGIVAGGDIINGRSE